MLTFHDYLILLSHLHGKAVKLLVRFIESIIPRQEHVPVNLMLAYRRNQKVENKPLTRRRNPLIIDCEGKHDSVSHLVGCYNRWISSAASVRLDLEGELAVATLYV